MAVTAFDTDALEERGVQDISELSDFTPNLNFLTSSGINGGQIALAFIRGVGQPEVFLQNDPGVGIYVDGVYFGRTQGAVFDVLDVERVEVLRGPQGTLYGRNTIGGAINLESQRPSESFEAILDLEAGAYDLAGARLRLSGPLSENLAGSVTVASRSRAGYVDADPHPACVSCTDDDLSDENFGAGRAALSWTPASNFTLDIAADYTSRDQAPIARRLVFYNPAINPLFPFADYNAAVMTAWGAPATAFVNPDPNTHSANFAGFDRQEVWGASATAEWELSSSVSFKSISGYRELDFEHSSDSDGSPLMINSILLERVEQSQASQEFQLYGTALNDRLDWIVGAFFMHEDASSIAQQTQNFTEAGLIVPFPPPGTVVPCFDPLDPLGSCPPRPPILGDLTSDNYAAFTHGVFRLTDRLSISGGIRFSREEKDFESVFFIAESFSDSWDSVTPRIAS